jgi:DNA-binding NtrC family response regulator
MTTILICDDDAGVRFAIEEALEALGARILSFPSAAEALPHIGEADVAITDLVMPEMAGFAFLTEAKKSEPDLPIIMLTARGSERIAVQALKQGAYDYIGKPFSLDELRLSVRRALETRSLRRSAADLALDRAVGKPIVGSSPAFRKVIDQATRVGRRDVTVLVHGETGTGKELIASILHASNPRRAKAGACIRFNCAAIAESLAEAELFGHEKGAFTGAVSARPGYFRQADGGTLVLDEVAELPLGIQGKLLRVLQEGEIQPVGGGAGGNTSKKVDVRVVACTHRDLRAEVSAGRFREDLFYRIAVVEISVPPLRERTTDIPELIDAFRHRYATRFDLGEGVHFTQALIDSLAARSWPGNVRELENAVARLLALAESGETIDVDRLEHIESNNQSKSSPSAVDGTLREQVGTFERSVVERMLASTKQNQSEAARRLGISRMTLIEKMKRYGLR